MKPSVAMYMVHNGHIPAAAFDSLAALSRGFPLLTLAPHVAKFISNRTAPGEPTPDWVLPIYPFQVGAACLGGR